MGRRKQGYVVKQSQEFIQFILDNFELDESKLGFISKGAYCSLYANINFKSNTLSVPISHLVWLLKYKVWPKNGMHIDHTDNNSINNEWSNLNEITQNENQAKKRGKGNRYYGSTKYGHGIRIDQDKRDKRYYVTRYLSSREEINKKNRKMSLGGYFTLEEAEQYIKEYIEKMNEPSIFDNISEE